jgi:hypothetical protein
LAGEFQHEVGLEIYVNIEIEEGNYGRRMANFCLEEWRNNAASATE